ncbi:hypothetical protein ACFL2A_00735 [Thermodesulfobacteriota bacterium]
MKKMVLLFIFIILSTHSSLALSEEKENNKPLDVGIINLIATPEKYDGKKVAVSGFGYFVGSEDDGIYLTEDIMKRFIFNNAIGITAYDDNEINRKLKNESHLEYTKIVGTFQLSKPKVHLFSFFPGHLINIESVSSLPDHSKDEKYKKFFGETNEAPKGAIEFNIDSGTTIDTYENEEVK